MSHNFSFFLHNFCDPSPISVLNIWPQQWTYSSCHTDVNQNWLKWKKNKCMKVMVKFRTGKSLACVLSETMLVLLCDPLHSIRLILDPCRIFRIGYFLVHINLIKLMDLCLVKVLPYICYLNFSVIYHQNYLGDFIQRISWLPATG